MTQPQPAAAVGGARLVERFGQEWRSLDELCSSFTDEQWDHGTDCPGWTVKDHLSHIIGTESMLLGVEPPPAPGHMPAHVHNPIGEMNEAWVDARRGRSGAEVLAEFRRVAADRLTALASLTDADLRAESWTPAGKGTYEGFMDIRIFDCWVHEQDMRRAVGRPGHLGGPVAEHALDRVVLGLPYVVGKKVGPPEGTSITFEVTGPTARTWAIEVDGGRARTMPEPPADPSATVTADFETFMATACGRWDPADPLADGRFRLGGDVALGRSVVEQLNFII